MILKVRVAGNDDPDYIEIELPGDSLSLEALILTASRYRTGFRNLNRKLRIGFF